MFVACAQQALEEKYREFPILKGHAITALRDLLQGFDAPILETDPGMREKILSACARFNVTLACDVRSRD